MASENKKNKARNSYIHNGGEKNDLETWKCRRLAYFTKRDRRLQNEKLSREEIEEELEE